MPTGILIVLASDVSFQGTLSYFWAAFIQRKGKFSCLKQWWDYEKTQIKLLCQQHTLNVTYHVTGSIRYLETELLELELLKELLKSSRQKESFSQPAGCQSTGRPGPVQNPGHHRVGCSLLLRP